MNIYHEEMIYFYHIFISGGVFFQVFAQSNNILEGTIKDHKTGKGIPDVNVYINSSTIGTT